MQVVGPDGSRRVQSALGQASALTKASGCKHLLLYKFKPESEEVGFSCTSRSCHDSATKAREVALRRCQKIFSPVAEFCYVSG